MKNEKTQKNTNESLIINLTPHSVRIIKEDGSETVFESKGVIRLAENRKKIGNINGITLNKKSFGSSELPKEKEGIYYIVSLPVAQAFPERNDFLVPDQLVRDEQGRVIGARSFASFIRRRNE